MGETLWRDALLADSFPICCRAAQQAREKRVMFGAARSSADQTADLDALDHSQAVIEFQADGTIFTANATVPNAMGVITAADER